jgi:predicted methyltransferase
MLDVDFKPAQILNFFQVAPSSQVLALFVGGGYYPELLNDIVGKDGHVTAYGDSMWYDYSKSDSDKLHMGKRLKNTHTVISDMNTLKLPKEKYDTALTVLGLHDIYVEEQKSLPSNNYDMTHLFMHFIIRLNLAELSVLLLLKQKRISNQIYQRNYIV